MKNADSKKLRLPDKSDPHHRPWTSRRIPGQAALTKLTNEADAMHALFVLRADALMGCTEGSEEEEELSAITDAIEAYEAKRWPEGKIPGGKG
jgi:hypothetical protein